MRVTGSVKWFHNRKGFGLIAPDGGGPDVFVHFTAIQGTDVRVLSEGQRVEFEVIEEPQGPRADLVRIT